MKLSEQSSFKTSLLAVGAGIVGLAGYLVAKWTGDKELAGYIVGILGPLAAVLAAYGSVLAERGAKQETQGIAAQTAQTVAAAAAQQIATDTAAQVAATTASAIATETAAQVTKAP